MAKIRATHNFCRALARSIACARAQNKQTKNLVKLPMDCFSLIRFIAAVPDFTGLLADAQPTKKKYTTLLSRWLDTDADIRRRKKTLLLNTKTIFEDSNIDKNE